MPGAELSCEVCGLMPEPPKTRLTLANIAVMLPIELMVHALVVETRLPYLAKVLVLTLTATVLVIWVAEPRLPGYSAAGSTPPRCATGGSWPPPRHSGEPARSCGMSPVPCRR